MSAVSDLADDLARLNRALDHIADPEGSRHDPRHLLGLDPEQLVPRHAAVDERGTSTPPAAPLPPVRVPVDEAGPAGAVASAGPAAPSDAAGLRQVVGLENPHEVTVRRSPGRQVLYVLAWIAGAFLIGIFGLVLIVVLGLVFIGLGFNFVAL